MTHTVRDADGDLATLNFVVTVATTQMTTVDLIVASVTASDDTLESGQSFDLTVTTSNSGTAASAATALRFYRSTNTTISSSDTEVGTDAGSALAARGTSSSVVTLTAPSTAGTCYYGACVDQVSGESDTGNNCSNSRAVTVRSGSMTGIIPDANLRAAIEAALGKASGAPITAAEMVALTVLDASNANISDLTGLEFAIDLTELWLGWNNISDPSPLAGLTNLTELRLFENNITDVSPLAGLNSLTTLLLGTNGLTGVSALGGLAHLSYLGLEFNRVTDISALVGLTNLRDLDLRGNPLSDSSINDRIPALESSGASVFFDSFRKGDYDIELVFLDHFTEHQKNVLQYVARRWMAVITEDPPDYEFTQGWSGTCSDQSYEIPAGERIDDLRIYMGTVDGSGQAVGYGGPSLLRQETHLPVLGCMSFDLSSANLLITGLHEIGHVLGFGTIWDKLGFLQNLDGDTHFNGPLAIAAFDEAGGSDHTGAKVPVQQMGGAHWRSSVFPGETMRPGGGLALSAITVQSLADLGCGVDVTQADAYTLPYAAATEARAQHAAAIPEDDPLSGSLAFPTRAGRVAGITKRLPGAKKPTMSAAIPTL